MRLYSADLSPASSFLEQPDSWSRIGISPTAFKSLISFCHVSHEFYSFVRSFGFRVGDTDTNFCGYFRRIHDIQDNNSLSRGASYGE